MKIDWKSKLVSRKFWVIIIAIATVFFMAFKEMGAF